MSVFLKANRWPNSRVPYVIIPDRHQAEAWFAEVNNCMGFSMLVPKKDSDTNYLQLTVGGYSQSEEIGYAGIPMQKIGGEKKFTVIHELLHALGFKHEQLHKKFPWDDDDPKRKVLKKTGKVDRMFSYKGNLGTDHNQKLYQAIMDTQKNAIAAVFFADNNLNSRADTVADQQTEHWGKCDMDSVMMYPDFAKALTLAGLDKHADVLQSGRSPKCDVLSNQDVAALQFMYPPPAPPLPRAFRVTFTANQPNANLRMSFSIRSTVNRNRVANFTASDQGQQVVNGFNPDQAEIRVNPAWDWAPLNVAPNSSTALKGGLYTLRVALV